MTRHYRWSGLALMALRAGCEPSELRPVPTFGGASSGESYPRLCIAAEKKWSLRTNCPTYDD